MRAPYERSLVDDWTPYIPLRLRKPPALALARRLRIEEEAARLRAELTLEDPDHFASTAAVLSLQARSCRWPLGDPRVSGFRFCGRETGATSAYCCEHHAAAFPGTQKAPTDRSAGALSHAILRQ